MNADQSYYCVIPSDLIAAPEIGMAAKLAYGVISSLAKREGYAWVSNAALGQMVGGKSARAAQEWIGQLQDAGWLRVVLGEGEGVNTKRRLYITAPWSDGNGTKVGASETQMAGKWKKTSRGGEENFQGGGKKTSTNNTTDNPKDKDSVPTERAAPAGTADDPVPFPLAAIREEVAEPHIITSPPQGPKVIEDRLWAKFLAIQPDHRFPASTYAKERKGVKRLVNEAFARQPEDPEAWLAGYVAAWARLKRDRKSLIYSQPNTPAAMSSGALMVRVLDEMVQAALFEDTHTESIPF